MDGAQRDPVMGCLMCDSLYVKANGELPCWDDVGEDLVLGTIDEDTLLTDTEERLLDAARLVDLRRAFLEGRDPHPGLCSKCAVRGHGVVTSLRPETIRVLHIEPAYLCQLACPQCIAPKLRLRLKKPPYYMSLSFYEALLRRLQEDGVRSIRLVHFEGRGDPLLNEELGEMIRCTRKMVPESFIKVTSHGNYPFKPWMLDSGLDLLRLSVDGAFEASYSRYRVGGALESPLRLMRSIRDNRRGTESRLRVEWKYILFEWNDSDEEIRRAARLADDLKVDLRFCLTHTPGRSRRFQSLGDLRNTLAACAPRAGRSVTFQLKPGPGDASIGHVVAEHVEALLLSALKCYNSGRSDEAEVYLAEALASDPGLSPADLKTRGGNPVREALEQILSACAFPSTLSALANIQLAIGEWEAAEQLFRAYLSLAPEAPDQPEVEQLLIALSVRRCLGHAVDRFEEAEAARVLQAELAALSMDPGFSDRELQHEPAEPVRGLLPAILSRCRYPKTILTLAQLRLLVKDFASAETLFKHYLKSSPRSEIESVLAYLEAIRRARRFLPLKRLLSRLVKVGR